MAGRAKANRFAALASLLAIFLLPLHFHSLAAPAKIAKECACLYGARLEAGPAPAPPSVIPDFDFQLFTFVADEESGRLSASSSSIRAPPALSVL
jgi:hypothetical protein